MQRVTPANPGLRILDFSPRIKEALRQLSHVQNREYDTDSPLVRVTNVCCTGCGFEQATDAVVHSDYLRAVTITHELSWVTGKRCGGQMEFVSEPAERAVGLSLLGV